MTSGVRMREIGTSGIAASVVGLGTFAIGGWFWGGTDEKKSIQAIQASLDHGINLIDTAPVYGFGLAEQIVGKALKGRRDKAVIATKVGMRWDTEQGIFDTHASEKGPTKDPAKYKLYKYLGPDGIRYEIEQSLKRLGTDHIDLYQTHWQESTTPIEETMGALEKLRQQGKVRAIGVSNVSVDQLRRYGKVASAQERFTLIDRGIVESGIVDYCVANSIAILSYFSMEQGLLTGSIPPDRVFKDGDTRKTKGLFSPDSIRQVNAIVAEFRPFAEKYKATIGQVVIALTAAQRGITHVLVGARNAIQAKENALGACIELSREDLAEMNTIADKLAALKK